ncbi:hypothetical protein LBMAG53_06550 [Planctomycetota bacterium]|nr:hypothetical protein LBMAG53_06550 [Planctomycetota bacterium]
MSARRIDGKALAEERRTVLAETVRGLAVRGIRPCLAAVTVRADQAWERYVRNQASACAAVGIIHREQHCPAQASDSDLAEAIEALNADPEVHGIIVQSPLPAGIDDRAAKALIAPGKDVEAVGPARLGQLLAGVPGPAPCTAVAAVELARRALLEIHGTRDFTGIEAVVVGASTIVGRPVAQLLLNAGATPTICHIGTRDLAEHTRKADLLIVAVGKAGLISASQVKPGAIVVDVGINRVIGPDGVAKTVGDVADDVWEVAGALTPVPGGVGAMTTTILLEATASAAAHGDHRPNLDAAAVRRLLGPAASGLESRLAERIARLIGGHLAAGGATVASALERRLASGVTIFDGAMGSELIARGVAPDQVVRAPLDHPDLVLAIHRAYREAGAEIATAATFAANRWRLGDRDTALRAASAGVRLARQAAAGSGAQGSAPQLVLGAIGPCGRAVGAEIAASEVEDAAGELALAMADAGADGLVLETMQSTAEAVAALAGCRRATSLPVIACRSIERDDPAEIAEFARAMESGGATGIGVNCAAGPRAMRAVVARLAASTRLPVLARPNAGFPEAVGASDPAGPGWRYHLRPAWLVDNAKAYVASGVAAVGGCCGVAPTHIAALATALSGAARITPGTAPEDAAAAAHADLIAADRVAVGHPLLARRDRLAVVGSVPARLPAGIAAAALRRLTGAGADAVALSSLWPGSPQGARLAARLRHTRDQTGAPAVLELSGGTSLRAAQDALIAAGLLGIDLVLVDQGGAPASTSAERASALDLVALTTRLAAGRDLAGSRLDAPIPLTCGVRLSGGAASGELIGLPALVSAGTAFVVLPPTYEPARFRALMTALDFGANALPIFAEVLLLSDPALAEELDNELPALSVPQRLKDLLAADPGADAAGVLKFLRHWRSRLAGVWISLADERTAPAEAVLRAVRAFTPV